MKKNIKRLAMTGVAVVVFTLAAVTGYAAGKGWIGSSNVANINDNLSRITVLTDDLKDDNKDKDKTIKEIEKLVKEQGKAIQDRNKEIEDLEKELSKKDEELDKAEDEAAKWKDRLKDAQDHAKKVEKELKTAQSDLKTTLETNKVLIGERDELNAKVNTLQNELDQALEDVKQIEKRTDDMVKELGK